ncbi:head maturation protease, ClpP-related [Paenarthrobacter sp. NPDC089714]|uniref:head maturation protease, ClpP-related n=1 Tax=Paenarthrobacter sp. NPDC089714 TaxID=3364377 RepID=UPI003805E4BD
MTLQMLKPSAASGPWYRMEASTETDTADLYIYEMIDSWWGVSASRFVRELSELDVSTINLYVNSPGGSVYDGVAIMNALRRHKATVVATVDGLAASAASFIIQAADEVVMGQGSELMIHEAWSFAYGNAETLQKVAGDLDRISGTIAEIYAERAGGTEDEWREAMKAETWYTADEAVTAGLADRVAKIAKKPETEDASNRFDLSIFAHAGRQNAPAPAVNSHRERRPQLSLVNGSALAAAAHMVEKTIQKPPAEPKDTITPEEKGTGTMSAKLNQGLRERLGIRADTELDEDQLLEALDEALEEQEAEEAPATAAAAHAPGTVVLDAAQYQELRNAADDGRLARQQQLADERNALVNAAVQDGRIPPARRDHWLNSIEADPGMADTLASLEPGLVPVNTVGYTGGVEDSTDEARAYDHIFPKES